MIFSKPDPVDLLLPGILQQFRYNLTPPWSFMPEFDSLTVSANGKCVKLPYKTIREFFDKEDYDSLTKAVNELIKQLNK